ncbi:hypothetical protein EV426DRAFT_610594 [Tirmania nivea]|nr:hypothetical protein EV426DRAFT_610594 [Tirmania nivea]
MDRTRETQHEYQQQQHSDAPTRVIRPALGVGALSGTTGFITGGLIATLKSSPTPGLFALGTGVNCFFLGSTYWAFRNSMLKLAPVWYPSLRIATPRDRTAISGAAGVLTGATGGLVLRGPGHVIPGAIIWGLVGTGAQYLYAIADERYLENVQQHTPASGETSKTGFWERAFRSGWSPVKRLTHEEYKRMLEGKLLGVEVDIALIDEEIENLRNSSDKTSGS